MAVIESSTPLARFGAIRDLIQTHGETRSDGVSVLTSSSPGNPTIDLAFRPSSFPDSGELYMRYRSPRVVKGAQLIRTRMKALHNVGSTLEPVSSTQLAAPEEVFPEFDFGKLVKTHAIPDKSKPLLVDVFLKQMDQFVLSAHL